MADQTFTSGQILTAAQQSALQTNIGLAQITPTSVTNATLSGGVATIGSAVTSVTISGCFTTTFTNYRIVLSGMVSSADGSQMQFTLNNSTGSTYATVGTNMDYTAATVYPIGTAAGASLRVGETSTTQNGTIIDVFQPFLATATFTNACWNGSSHVGWYNGRDTNAASQTGFRIALNTGTMTGGTITVYGYR